MPIPFSSLCDANAEVFLTRAATILAERIRALDVPVSTADFALYRHLIAERTTIRTLVNMAANSDNTLSIRIQRTAVVLASTDNRETRRLLVLYPPRGTFTVPVSNNAVRAACAHMITVYNDPLSFRKERRSGSQLLVEIIPPMFIIELIVYIARKQPVIATMLCNHSQFLRDIVETIKLYTISYTHAVPRAVVRHPARFGARFVDALTVIKDAVKRSKINASSRALIYTTLRFRAHLCAVTKWIVYFTCAALWNPYDFRFPHPEIASTLLQAVARRTWNAVRGHVTHIREETRYIINAICKHSTSVHEREHEAIVMQMLCFIQECALIAASVDYTSSVSAVTFPVDFVETLTRCNITPEFLAEFSTWIEQLRHLFPHLIVLANNLVDPAHSQIVSYTRFSACMVEATVFHGSWKEVVDHLCTQYKHDAESANTVDGILGIFHDHVTPAFVYAHLCNVFDNTSRSSIASLRIDSPRLAMQINALAESETLLKICTIHCGRITWILAPLETLELIRCMLILDAALNIVRRGSESLGGIMAMTDIAHACTVVIGSVSPARAVALIYMISGGCVGAGAGTRDFTAVYNEIVVIAQNNPRVYDTVPMLIDLVLRTPTTIVEAYSRIVRSSFELIRQRAIVAASKEYNSLVNTTAILRTRCTILDPLMTVLFPTHQQTILAHSFRVIAQIPDDPLVYSPHVHTAHRKLIDFAAYKTAMQIEAAANPDIHVDPHLQYAARDPMCIFSVYRIPGSNAFIFREIDKTNVSFDPYATTALNKASYDLDELGSDGMLPSRMSRRERRRKRFERISAPYTMHNHTTRIIPTATLIPKNIDSELSVHAGIPQGIVDARVLARAFWSDQKVHRGARYTVASSLGVCNADGRDKDIGLFTAMRNEDEWACPGKIQSRPLCYPRAKPGDNEQPIYNASFQMFVTAMAITTMFPLLSHTDIAPQIYSPADDNNDDNDNDEEDNDNDKDGNLESFNWHKKRYFGDHQRKNTRTETPQNKIVECITKLNIPDDIMYQWCNGRIGASADASNLRMLVNPDKWSEIILSKELFTIGKSALDLEFILEDAIAMAMATSNTNSTSSTPIASSTRMPFSSDPSVQIPFPVYFVATFATKASRATALVDILVTLE